MSHTSHPRRLLFLSFALMISSAQGQTGDVNVDRTVDEIYRQAAKLEDPEERTALLLRAVEITKRAVGEMHPATADLLSILASNYQIRLMYPEAEAAYKRELEITKKVDGPAHERTAGVMVNLAALYQKTGAFPEAESLYASAIEITRRNPGDSNFGLITSLRHLANQYAITGAFDLAEPLFKEAADMAEKSMKSLSALNDSVSKFHHDEAHWHLMDSLRELADLYRITGDYLQAQKLYRRALELAEVPRRQNDNPMRKSEIWVGLAATFEATGDIDQALKIYALVWEESGHLLRDDHPFVARLALQIATLQSVIQTDEAEETYQQALSMFERLLGQEHPETGAAMRKQAAFYWQSGNVGKALPLRIRAREIEEKSVSRTLAIGTEERKRQYLSTLSHDADVSYSLLGSAPGARELGASAVLQLKGRVLDATVEGQSRLRKNMDEPARALFRQLQQVVSSVAQLGFARPEPGKADSSGEQLAALKKEQVRLETELSRRSLDFQQVVEPVTLQRVQAALGATDVLIEWTRFRPLDLKARSVQPVFGAPRYAAYLITRDQPPAVLDLGPADAIELSARRLQRKLLDRLGEPRPAEARELHRLVMQPLLAPLAKLQARPGQVLLSPDGALNLVPMAALVDEQGRFLGEQFSLSYLSSGRDLLRLKSTAKPRSGMVVIANPDFDSGRLAPPGAAVARAGDPSARNTVAGQRAAEFDRSGSAMMFSPLSGTEREARMLQSILGLPETQLARGEAATEGRLKRLSGPAILHIATHGFFLQDLPQAGPKAGARGAAYAKGKNRGVEDDESDPPPPKPRGLGESPLLRSGLALAGANRRGSEDGEDGIVTAAEVAQLDLEGTQLVVLSACETGTGEVANGEGVYGLRRALVLAGAQSELVSLWKVDDDATAQLMGDYYRRLKQGEGRAQALRSAQAALRANPATAHPYFWAPFIPVGDWSPLKFGNDSIATR